jgi:DNA-binding SARP family transcriptional activator
MRFRLLGPIEAWDDGSRIEVRGSKMRTVLASLLLSRGRIVSDFNLIEMLWGENPPSTTQAQIQTYVSRLRGLLGPEVRIERQHPGYRLDIPPGLLNLDLVEFERLAEQGHAALAANQMWTAVEVLRTALALWQGQALAGVTDHLATMEQPRLEEARLSALEDRIAADLALGQHAPLITELTALTAAQPLRERPRAQLMLALYRSGRTADALAAYQGFRRILAEELGLDPSAKLKKLHQSILTGDPELLPALVGHHLEVLPTVPVLPPEPADFTGRVVEAARVRALQAASQEHGAGAYTCAITGMSGVGKTALALHVARQLREHSAHRQIRIDLGGRRRRSLSPAAVLARVVKVLGTHQRRIPKNFDDLMALYRDSLSAAPTLLFLDDAENERQVRPLLPGVAGCGVLITSRSRLTALDGICRIDLDVFASDQSVELLAKIAGSDRVKAQEQDARRIADLCDNLPLAIRISGARLAARPHWPLARLADRLTNAPHVLDELRLADLDVGADLASSCWSLSAGARQALQVLSRLEPPSFSSWTAAEHLDVSSADAENLAEELVEAHLLKIDSASPDHYRFPNLVRALTAQKIRLRESAGNRAQRLRFEERTI